MWGRRETALAASQSPRGLAQLNGVCVRGVYAQDLQLGELPAWLLFPSVPSGSGLCSGAFSAWQPLANQSCWPGGQAFLWRHVLVLAGRASATPKDLSGAASFLGYLAGRRPAPPGP